MISKNAGISLLLVVTAAVVATALLLPRIPQPQSYHLFADQRRFLGIPNFANVISNFPFAAIGLSCDTGISWTLPRLIGRAKALELLLTPRTVRAPEAADLGLVTRVVRDTVMAQVELQAGPYRLVSLMSREAADELGLDSGVLAAAVVKSTNVVIETVDRA